MMIIIKLPICYFMPFRYLNLFSRHTNTICSGKNDVVTVFMEENNSKLRTNLVQAPPIIFQAYKEETTNEKCNILI